MEENQQEILMKLSMIEQQIQTLQNQIKSFEEDTIRLQRLKMGLEELKESNEKEIFAQIANGIFIKAEIDSKDLLVDIGGKNFVKRNIDETNELIEGQIKKVNSAKTELNRHLEEIGKEAEKIISEFKKN